MTSSTRGGEVDVNPFYHGALTNILGGAVWGYLQPYLYPAIPTSHMLIRTLIGVGAGVLFSIGILALSLLPSWIFECFEGFIKSRLLKDFLYSVSSIVATMLILTALMLFLLLLYGGRLPLAPANYITLHHYLDSLFNTEWLKLSLIPAVGSLLKFIGREIKLALTR
ncbi:hypothetical protein J7L06_07515 [Candidatus Bathyarchaeota archaeon]|nr:hypothetical protein [Candidatus Bathyarchaeota archaeon]